MDWTLTGVLGGVAILAVTAGYGLSAIVRSSPEPTKQVRATPALIPTPERPVVNATASAPATGYTLQSTAPAVVDAPAPQAYPPQVSSTAGSSSTPFRVDTPPPLAARPKDHSPLPDNPISAYKEARLPPLQPKPQISSDVWEVRTTAKANYFNLGGHVDGNGVVDSLASSYLRDALMKHKNYPKLPAQIQASINRPTINLAKIAGYRALLGINDKEMEEKQGVTFIRISGSRSMEIAGPGDADFDATDFDASPIDLATLDKMDADLRRGMTQGLVR
jgi:hypothetical protein